MEIFIKQLEELLMSNSSTLSQSHSKLLIYEPPLQALPSLAVAIGLNEALVLQQIHYWISNPTTKNKVDGKNWVYNTYEDWKKQFPFWSTRTIRTIFSSLKDKKLIIVGSYNEKRWHTRKWYTIDYNALNSLMICSSDKNDKCDVAEVATWEWQKLPHGSGRSCHMGVAEVATPTSNIDYTETTSKITTENNIVRLSDFDKKFEEFWDGYNNKKSKEKCQKAYSKLLKEKGVNLHNIIINAIEAQKRERESSDALGIWQPARKMPLTWLNGHCWEDEVKTQEELDEERKRVVSKVSAKPMGMSAVDQYNVIIDKIGKSAEAEVARIKRAEALERGEEWEWDGLSSSLGIPDF